MKSFFFSVFALALTVSAGVQIDTIKVSGLPYANQHNGVFAVSGSYNNFPVYKSLKNAKWQMYKRQTGKWVLDFNDISEEHSGTVAFSTTKVDRPWLSAWKDGWVIAGAGIDRIIVDGLPYPGLHNGIFIVDSLYNDFPVYKSIKDKRFQMYKRQTGKWVLDFNAISEEHSGTVAFSTSNVLRPWLSAWKNGNVSFSSPLPKIYVTGLAYAIRHNGDFTLTGTYNGNPVYTSTKNNDWRMYKRKNGIWVLDFDAIDEKWDGTAAYSTKAYRPWMGTWRNGNVTSYPM